MNYSLATLWHERKRYLPGVMAVAFSALLIFFQGGLLVGQFSLTSTPIDHARADIWVGHPMNLSVDLGRPIPERWMYNVAAQPEVDRVETYIIGLVVVDRPDGRSELCTIIGSDLGDEPLGAVRELTPDLRDRLTEPGSVVADKAELGRLGFGGVGDNVEVMGRRVRLVGTVQGLRSLAAPYLFCSLQTARMFFQGVRERQTIFVLARCRQPGEAEAVVRRLRNEYGLASAFTSAEFSTRTRLHWVTATKAGLATFWSAILGLILGLAITSQTLYAAAAASRREYAVLDALGIPTRRMAVAMLAQSFWLGAAGLAIALPAALGVSHLLNQLGVKVLLPAWLVVPASALTLVAVLLSGLFALRSLRLIEPAQLLR
jgi:putative ABC transport system permease protein